MYYQFFFKKLPIFLKVSYLIQYYRICMSSNSSFKKPDKATISAIRLIDK